MTKLELTQMTQIQLDKAEKVIDSGLRTFVDVGNALLAIRDGRGYRLQGFKTFEAYCQERWNMVRQQANRLIAAAETVSNLEPIGSTFPATESQARPLAGLEPEQQREAWSRAVGDDARLPQAAAHEEYSIRA